MFGFIMFCLFVLLLALAIVVLLNAFVQIPPVHYGVATIFGWRSGRVVHEGLHLRIPWLEKFLLIPYELKNTPIVLSVPTKDRLEVSITGSTKWRPDCPAQDTETGRHKSLERQMKNRLIRLIEISEDAIRSGLVDAIKNHIGQVAGQHDGTDFIHKKGAIHLLIKCILMLEDLPHRKPLMLEEKKEDGITGKYLDGTVDTNMMDTNFQIKTDMVLEFYQTYAKAIGKYLKANVSTEKGASEIEDLYSINIQVFDLADIDFSPETKRAFEEKTQVGKKIEAQEQKLAAKREMMKKLTAPRDQDGAGLTEAQADYMSNVMLGIADPKQVVEIMGNKGNLSIINLKP